MQIGWVIVGGMSLGTLLTIFVVPTMYTLFARKAVPGANKTVENDAPVRSHEDPQAQPDLGPDYVTK
jgi:multidrug efflux pump